MQSQVNSDKECPFFVITFENALFSLYSHVVEYGRGKKDRHMREKSGRIYILLLQGVA